jgi:hypothetical protein
MRLAALLACFAAAAADETKKVDVVCPIDGTRFTATEVVRTDASLGWGGVDSDFCHHAYRTLPMENYIWTCPTCWFSGGKPRFDPKKAPPEDLRKKIPGALKPALPIAAGAKQESIPGWVKYDLTAQVDTIFGAPPIEIARRHRNAAWAARQAGAVRLDDYDDWVEASRAAGLEKDTVELGKKNRSEEDLAACRRLEKEIAAGKHSGAALLLRRYLLAVTYRRRGENIDALLWLDEVDKARGENSVIDDAAKKVRASIEAERGQFKKASELYAKAVADAALDDTTRAQCQYILGEVARRNGESTVAGEWYAKVIATSPDPELKRRAETQRALLK